MVGLIASLLLSQGQAQAFGHSVEGVAPIRATPTYMPGQREIVLGPETYPDTVMGVAHSKEIPAKTWEGDYGPPYWEEYSLGTVRWSVKDGDLFNQPCRLIKLSGQTRIKGKFEKSKKSMDIVRDTITTWYVSPEGRILGQLEVQTGFGGTRTASCTYGEESIEIKIDEGGKRSVATLYPGQGMEPLNNQFRPMVVDGKIVTSDKEFEVLDPFSRTFQKWKVSYGGRFKSTWLQRKYAGYCWDIKSPQYTSKAFVSDKGELVKVEFPGDNFMIIGALDMGGGLR